MFVQKVLHVVIVAVTSCNYDVTNS